MKDQDKNKAWGFTLFYDDFRVEVGGKVSMMGLYQADMLLPANLSFPISIPKLCAMVMYYEKIAEIPEDVKFTATFGPENISMFEFTPPKKAVEPSQNNLIQTDDTTDEDKERITHVRIPIVFSPFVIPGKGRLRIRAHYPDGSILKLGSLAVRQVPVDEFNRMLNLPTSLRPPSEQSPPAAPAS